MNKRSGNCGTCELKIGHCEEDEIRRGNPVVNILSYQRFNNGNKVYNRWQKLVAFTLSEVLITLGIIGVVAALTIPVLLTPIQNKEYQVKYRKAYSTVNQALKRMLDDGYVVDTQTGGGFDPNVTDKDFDYYKEGPVAKNFVILAQYFVGATTCFDHNADVCFACGIDTEAGGICNKKNMAFIDASGMAYYLYSGREWPIIVDVNGFSKPNKLGRDRYVLYFSNSITKNYYSKDVDVILPWKDINTKQRWCPSGDCPNTSRLFGNGGSVLNIDLDNPNTSF